MALWAIHFRIADHIIDHAGCLDTDYFIIGNIAPDCGIPVAGGYFPPSEITHRTGGGNYKGNCDYDSIYRDFIKNETDIKRKSFWIGYFVHYITDCLWVSEIYDALEDKYGPLPIGSALNNKIRKEWSNLDYTYFYENVSASFEKFKMIDSFDEDYPAFYRKGDITSRMKFIKNFYLTKPIKMNYKYTSMDEVNDFIVHASKVIDDKLREYNIAI